MILHVLKNMYPKASEAVLRAVIKDLEKCRGKNMSTEEPQEDSRTNSPKVKKLLGYMARHHEDLEKCFTDEQKEIFEKFNDCWSEYMSLA